MLKKPKLLLDYMTEEPAYITDWITFFSIAEYSPPMVFASPENYPVSIPVDADFIVTSDSIDLALAHYSDSHPLSAFVQDLELQFAAVIDEKPSPPSPEPPPPQVFPDPPKVRPPVTPDPPVPPQIPTDPPKDFTPTLAFSGDFGLLF